MKKLLISVFCFFPLFLNAAFLQESDIRALNETAKKHLVSLINIDTSQPEPNETMAARYIYKVLNKNKIDWEIYRTEKPRANLIARLKADADYAKNNPEEPLILISHLDTASVQEGWTLPPTKATLKDDRIYGLGSTDAKNYAAVNLTILTWLKQNDIKLKRDIIFLFTADEESGSTKGLKFLYDQHASKIKAGYALNEGGGLIPSENDMKDIMFVEAANKMYMDILLTAYGDGAHASIPTQSNAIYRLSQALSVLESYKLPVRITPFTKNFFERIYHYQDDDAQTTMSIFLNTPAGSEQFEQAAKIITEDNFFKTQITNTISPTIITSGVESNTVSSEAYATLNCRLLPDTNPMDFFADLSHLFENDDNISLTIIERPELPFPQPDPDTSDPLFEAIERSVTRLMPGTLTLAGMTPASNESEFMRRNGVIAYGIGPAMEKAGNGPHEPNENILEDDFYEQLRLTLEIVLDFAEIRLEAAPLPEDYQPPVIEDFPPSEEFAPEQQPRQETPVE